jgi:hypothetical protein
VQKRIGIKGKLVLILVKIERKKEESLGQEIIQILETFQNRRERRRETIYILKNPPNL